MGKGVATAVSLQLFFFVVDFCALAFNVSDFLTAHITSGGVTFVRFSPLLFYFYFPFIFLFFFALIKLISFIKVLL